MIDAGRSAMRDSTGSLARAGLIVSGAFLVSRALGYVRVWAITTVFGPDLAGTIFAAFRIPDLIFQLVAAGALGSALVPVVAGLLQHDEDTHAWRVVSTVANLMLIALLVLTVGFWLAAPVVVPLVTPGFGPADMERTVELTRIMLLGPMFLALSGVASSLLNAAGRFTAAAIAPVLYNLAIIVATLGFGATMGVTAAAVGVVVGSVASLAVQLVDIRLRTGYRHRPRIDIADDAGRRVFILLAPRALGLGAVQITFIVNTALASALGAAAITAYQVAFTILQLPLGLIAQPLGVVLLPAMSRAAAAGERDALGVLVDRSLRLLAYAMMFVTVVAIVLRQEIVTLLFGSARFGAAEVALTADTLLVFLLGLPAHSLIAVQARAFYAGQDTRTPVAAAIVAVAINVAVSVATVGPLGLRGLALGIALGAWAEALLLLTVMGRRGIGVESARELRTWFVFLVGSLLAGLGAWVTMAALTGAAGAGTGKLLLLVELALAGGVALLIFVGYSLALRRTELPMIVRLIRQVGSRSAA